MRLGWVPHFRDASLGPEAPDRLLRFGQGLHLLQGRDRSLVAPAEQPRHGGKVGAGPAVSAYRLEVAPERDGPEGAARRKGQIAAEKPLAPLGLPLAGEGAQEEAWK
jgi:hypothetical protein